MYTKALKILELQLKLEGLKKKYQELANDYYFVPIGIETYGSWGPEGLKLMKTIGAKLKEATGERKSTFFLTQSISMAIQRGNASCVLGTVPHSEGLEDP